MNLPPGAPWTDVTFAGVYWQEQERLPGLLETASRWFTHIRVGVQTDDPDNDETLKIARSFTDDIYVDSVQGYAEPTLHTVVMGAKTPWTFVISGDERPSEQLLGSMQDMLYMAEWGDDYSKIDGFWIRFVSSIEGVGYPSEQDNHLRLFRTSLGWPATMHSRPPTKYATFWHPTKGVIYHDRTLDEMILDYQRYLKLSGSNPEWTAHNRLMMHDAVTATAVKYGWEYIEKYEWWPAIKKQAFDGCTERCSMPDAGFDCRAVLVNA